MSNKSISQPPVHIIIINWNGYAHTKDCLDSLKKLEYKNYQVIVIDNGSKNKEAEKLFRKYPSTTFICNKTNRGYAYANNQGIKLALRGKAKYILLLNNDTIVKSDFLKHLVSYAEENNFQGVLTPKILFHRFNKIWAMGGRLSISSSIPQMIGQGKPSSKYNKIIEPDYASGCAFFINSSVIRKVGLLDPIYFAYYEDADWSFRIKKAGYKIRVIPKSIIWHKVSQSTTQSSHKKIGVAQSYLLARNGLIFGIKNLRGLKKTLYLFAQIIIKFPLYLLLKTDNNRSTIAYSRGIQDGTKYILNTKTIPPFSKSYVK